MRLEANLATEKDNKDARVNFIIYWAEYVRNNDDKLWGDQHTRLINAMMQHANQIDPKLYLKIKGENR